MRKHSFKNWPLSFQIWVILGIILGCALALVMLLFPITLRATFTNEIYAQLEESQLQFLANRNKLKDEKAFSSFFANRPPPVHFRIPRHVMFYPDQELPMRELGRSLIEGIRRDALSQVADSQRYFLGIDDMTVMYLISKVNTEEKPAYVISYMWGGYRDNLVRVTLWQSLLILGFVLMVSWVASSKIARYVTKPLTNLQVKVQEIAEQKWDSPVSVDRGDEIGKLAETVEWMRQRLIEQNDQQQSFLQKVSHELKTPVMVIRSYAQAIRDGIFPGGTLESSIDVIESESDRLEKRIRSLLHLSKLEYFSSHRLERREIELASLTRRVAGRFELRRPEVTWNVDLNDVTIMGDSEALTVTLENLFDNQVRYAESRVDVVLQSSGCEDEKALISVFNDGPKIEPEILGNLFSEFKKGSDGEFGLGLAIVRMIVENHGGRIWADNEDQGVAFYIEFPKAQS